MLFSSFARAKTEERIRIYVWAALLLSLCTTWHFFSLPYAISGDTAMYLQTGQFLLEGKLPYRDFQDLNPPLIMYVCALPALLPESHTWQALVASLSPQH
ncbi:MAG: hypothetical protein IPJ49_10765 [Candidatus Obscuribacter sp.]|nr:hypothetical protein [Candidatus Obscuribacter sp.]